MFPSLGTWNFCKKEALGARRAPFREVYILVILGVQFPTLYIGYS
jgi:hypothetical protein